MGGFVSKRDWFTSLRWARYTAVSLTFFLINCAQKQDLQFTDKSSLNQATTSLCVAPGVVAETPLLRLGRVEYERSLRILFGDSAVNLVANDLLLVPPETSVTYSTELGDINVGHAEGYFRVARSLSKVLVADSAFQSQYLSCILAAGSATPSVTCVESSIRPLGDKIYRRPMDDAEYAFVKGVFDQGQTLSNLEGVEVALRVMLSNSPFIYRMEGRGKDLGNGVQEVSPYELASRISFFLTRATPDSTLLANAANQDILKPSVLSSEIDRLLSGALGRSTMKEFFREWAGYNALQTLNFSSSDFSSGLPGGDFSPAARSELDTFFDDIFNGGGKFEDIYLSRNSWVDSTLASIYGLPSGTPLNTKVSLNSNQFAGVLTRVGFLANGTTMPSPMHLGATLRRKFLCDDLPPPPPNITAAPAPGTTATSGTLLSSRERYEIKTSSATTCMGCHSQINGLGFALLDRDAIGRFNGSNEHVFDTTGTLIGQVNIDTSSSPNVVSPNEAEVQGAVGLSQVLAQSLKAKQCFVKSSFQYLASRKPTLNDGCHLETAVNVINSGGKLSDVVKAIFTAPEFRQYKSGP